MLLLDGLSINSTLYLRWCLRVKVHLFILYTPFISNGCLPDSFMKLTNIPRIKNKTGDTNVKDNYRPTALVTVTMLRIFELCLF